MGHLLRYRINALKATFLLFGLLGSGLFALLPFSLAAASSLQPAARISFTFDDGLASSYTQAAPVLANHGLNGTNYVITGCVGMTAVPNTCRADNDRSYMTWAQVQALQNTYGWEIGSHTVDHKCLASSRAQDPDDCQATALTKAQVDAELANSKSALASHGITATDFAPPYGDYNNTVLAEIAKYYASMRNFRNDNHNVNSWPYSDYYLWDYIVQEGTTPVSAVETAIDQAIANNQWLILSFHDIQPSPSTDPDDYQYGTSELDQIAAYVQAKQAAGQIQPVTINQGLVSGTNLLSNASFDNGIAGGWTTDAPANITKDTATNGSYPSPTNAIKFVSGSSAVHLFSPRVAVDPNTTYVLKNFLNVQKITSGEVGFYIDEYDANGNWISGQWKAAEKSPFVEDMNFTYKPTSASVRQAALQVYATGNPGITAYLDNAQWYAASTAQPANLAPNGAFDDGIADGWATDDSTNIKADAGNNGSPANPVNSVYLQSKTTASNGHLFSPQIAVSSTKTYSISSWLNLKQLAGSGEVGFYIDEYDASGNWISGQYKTGVHTLGAGNVGFTYQPSSTNVAKASLQIIVVGNAGIQAYIDDVHWIVN